MQLQVLNFEVLFGRRVREGQWRGKLGGWLHFRCKEKKSAFMFDGNFITFVPLETLVWLTRLQTKHALNKLERFPSISLLLSPSPKQSCFFFFNLFPLHQIQELASNRKHKIIESIYLELIRSRIKIPYCGFLIDYYAVTRLID